MINGLKALAHEGRAALLRDIISAGQIGISSGRLAQKHKLNLTTTSAQLTVLFNAGLVMPERKGRSVIYRPNDKQISAVLAFLIRDVCQGRAEIIWPLTDSTGHTF